MQWDVAKLSELLPFLQQAGTQAKKRLSQNFLVDGNILRKIIATSQAVAGDVVLEIGPGPGALTELLLKQGVHLIAVEKDAVFAKELERLQTKYPGQLEIFCQDICTFDIAATLQRCLPAEKKGKVIANLPYQLTSTILGRFLPLHSLFSSLTFMVQHEVALRITAPLRCSDYSSLTLFSQFYSSATYAFKVGNRCFYPAPKVDSAVVQFALHPPSCDEGDSFFSLIKQAFQHKRKMLRASLRDLYSLDVITQALQCSGLSPQARPQELTLEEFKTLLSHLERLRADLM